MSQQTYTQEQINQMLAEAKQQWIEQELNPIVTERDELLKLRPKEKTEAEKEIERLKAELLQQKLVSSLRQMGAEDFADFISVSDESELQAKVAKLQEALKKRSIDSSFKPDNHRQTDAYSQAESKGDVIGMIESKLQKLYK
ncbi:hypothetical protein PACILC2_57190 [Paenibacillus cisolokensis]|uniref:DUF4355 domain-containing protein n=1 Tax=Paenibacillus cisolokensis TaxID=1658519 RepID=A0ABQ4NFY4_9BACL|nr:hypothetical protein [Paenibacillus cisolokensis]GIQ67151.1 hypothetical protein PACILC2_57190 [Paenibacillus cisolokensis]